MRNFTKALSTTPLLSIFILFLSTHVTNAARKDDNAVLLRDVEAITLVAGKMTNGRRSSPVPQLTCVGGTAGCSQFQPKRVQCYNRGWDGQDVQWECKAEMDQAYEFGSITVSCEGYSYPDDPYVLKGSCGLEYTIDYSKDGHSGKNSRPHSYDNTPGKKPKTSALTDILIFVVVGIMIYGLYVTCFSRSSTERMNQYSTTNDDQGGPGSGYPRRSFFGPSAPPPPGFHPDFTTGPTAGASCGPGAATRTAGSGSGLGGFWTGAATGGLLGYMLGNRNTGTRGYSSRRRDSDYGSNENWGGTSTSGFYEQRRSSPERSGSVRETSGFGGTTRR